MERFLDAVPTIPQWVVWLIIVGAVLLILGYTVEWGSRYTGFGDHVVKETISHEYPIGSNEPVKRTVTAETQTLKTMWDWMAFVTLSAVIVGVVSWFAHNQRVEQQNIQNLQADDDAVLAYLDTMSALIFDRPLLDPIDDPKLSEEEREQAEREREQARDVARASTLVALGKVGPDHKKSIVKFLYESDLIKNQSQIVDLAEANLSDAILENGEFPGIDLSDAFLGDGDDEELLGANLIEANLEGASLQEANLRNANLQDAKLEGAVFGDGEDRNRRGANLREADLGDGEDPNRRGANLKGADLQGVNLKDTDLKGVNLRNANLQDAKLEAGATGHTNNKLLDQQGAFLKGATMPNGQKYEAWLKGEDEAGDEETTAPS